MGSPDFRLHWELTLLKDFVSQSAKGFGFLLELSDALWESRADCAVLQLSQGTRAQSGQSSTPRNVPSAQTQTVTGCDLSRLGNMAMSSG